MAVDEQRIAAAFERAPGLIAQLTAAGPYRGVDEVIARAEIALKTFGDAEKAAVLASHPRLGAPKASLTGASAREQGAGTDDTTARELERLNDDYERRFGFRCVIHVAGRPLASLVPVMRERLLRARAEELDTGLAEFLAIARDRLSQ